VVVRVAADTVVSPTLLRQLVPYFRDGAVGGVTGMSLPMNARSWLGCMRLIEVHYNIGFVRSAQSALDVVMVMPGVLASYRRELLVALAASARASAARTPTSRSASVGSAIGSSTTPGSECRPRCGSESGTASGPEP
jgi:hypothetical protein